MKRAIALLGIAVLLGGCGLKYQGEQRGFTYTSDFGSFSCDHGPPSLEVNVNAALFQENASLTKKHNQELLFLDELLKRCREHMKGT